MTDPTDLEPKNGDFVAYIDSLQDNSIEALKLVNAYRMAHDKNSNLKETAISILTREENNADERATPKTSPAVVARDNPQKRRRNRSPRPNPAFFVILAVFFFTFFSIFSEIANGNEVFIVPVLVMFFTLFFNIVKNKNR